MSPYCQGASFALVLDKPNAERAAFPDGGCANGPALRHHLEALPTASLIL